MGCVGHEAHLGPVGLVNAVQHGVDGLGQIFQLLLGTVHRQTGIQVGVVDLPQPGGQFLQLLGTHIGHVAQPAGRGGQVLDGPEHFTDRPRVLKKVGDQGDHLADQQYLDGKGDYPHLGVQVQGNRIGLSIFDQLHGVGGSAFSPAQVEQQGAPAARQRAQPFPGVVRQGQPAPVPALDVPVQGCDGIVPGLHPFSSLR